MGLRYRKTVQLGKILSLNISKSGLSLTIRLGKAGFNLSKRGIRPFLNLGKGFSWRK
ncbi:DUF4236 domain-containing protein [bacterium]|nr:DUF4236 domain-containing protein [bacterium]